MTNQCTYSFDGTEYTRPQIIRLIKEKNLLEKGEESASTWLQNNLGLSESEVQDILTDEVLLPALTGGKYQAEKTKKKRKPSGLKVGDIIITPEKKQEIFAAISTILLNKVFDKNQVYNLINANKSKIDITSPLKNSITAVIHSLPDSEYEMGQAIYVDAYTEDNRLIKDSEFIKQFNQFFESYGGKLTLEESNPIEDKEGDENDNVKDYAFMKASFEFDPKDSMSKSIRLLLASLIKRDQAGDAIPSNILGLIQPVKMSEVSTLLLTNLVNLPADFDVYMDRLEWLSQEHPEIDQLMHRFQDELGSIEVDNSTVDYDVLKFRNEFIQNFAKTLYDFQIGLLRKGTLYSIPAASNNVDKTVRREFKNNIIQKYRTVQEFRDALDTKSVLDMANALGIYDLTEEDLKRKLDDNEKVSNKIHTIRNTIINAIDAGVELQKLYDKNSNESLNIQPALSKVAKFIADTKRSADLNFRNAEGKQVYGISLNNYQTITINTLNWIGSKNISLDSKIELVRQYLPSLLDAQNFRDNKITSIWINRILNGDKLMIGVYDGIQGSKRKSFSDLKELDLYTFHLSVPFEGTNFAVKHSSRSTIFTYRFADKFTYVKNPDYNTQLDQAVDYLYDYYLDEQNVINTVDGKKVVNFGKLGKTKLNFPYVTAKDEEGIRNEIRANLEKKIKNFKDKATKYGAFRVANGKPIGLSTEAYEYFKDSTDPNLAASAFAYINSYITHIEEQKVLLGSTALYKNLEDEYKRLSTQSSTGNIMVTDRFNNAYIEYVNARDSKELFNPKTGKVEKFDYKKPIGKFSEIITEEYDKYVSDLTVIKPDLISPITGKETNTIRFIYETNLIKTLKPFLISKGKTDAQANKIISDQTDLYEEKYQEVNENDGQSHITIFADREYQHRAGSWTKEKENNFQLQLKALTLKDRSELKDLSVYVDKATGKTVKAYVSNTADYVLVKPFDFADIQEKLDLNGNDWFTNTFEASTPLKGQYVGPVELGVDNLNVVGIRKTSYFVLQPTIVLGTNLQLLNTLMIQDGIDLHHFASSAKTGRLDAKVVNPELTNGLQFYNEDGTFNYDTIKSNVGLMKSYLDVRFMKDQLKINNYVKYDIKNSTQSAKIILSNITSDGVPRDVPEHLIALFKEADEAGKRNMSEFYRLISDYKEVFSTLIERNIDNLKRELEVAESESGLDIGNFESLVRLLTQAAQDRNATVATVEAIEKFAESKVIEMLPNKSKIENILFSIVSNRIINFKRPGSSYAQASITGFEDIGNRDLHDGKPLNNSVLKFYSPEFGSSTTPVKEGVDEIFNNNSDLSKIGTKSEYSQYLNTIFPNSKVKDIVYHGTNLNFDKFDKTKIGGNTAVKGEKPSFSFSNNKQQAEAYSSEITVGQNTNELAEAWFEENQHVFKNGDISTGIIDINNVFDHYKKELEDSKEMISLTGEIDPVTDKYKLIPVNDKNLKELSEIKTKEWQQEYNTLLTAGARVMSVILNIKNPKIVDFKGEKKSVKFKEEQLSTKGDAFIAKNIDDWGKGDVIQVFEPEQIHILGSKEDIQKFKEWKENNSNNSIIKVNPAEIAMPLPDKWFKYLLDRYNTQNIQEAIDKYNADPLKILVKGLRIPNQQLSSNDIFAIKTFYVPTMETFVVIPSEMVVKSGGDFDIDKLNIYFPILAGSINNTEVKDGVNLIFTENPTLNEIGTKSEYSQYLNSIFPNSKLKDIVYHGSSNIFEEFSNDLIGKNTGINRPLGIYFTPNRKIADFLYQGSSEERLDEQGLRFREKINSGKVYSALLNIDYIKEGETLIHEKDAIDEYDTEGLLEYDSYIAKNKDQIHILGTKQDIEGFKTWKKSNSNKLSDTEMLQNKLIDIEKELLLHPDNLHNLLKPLVDDKLKVQTLSEVVGQLKQGLSKTDAIEAANKGDLTGKTKSDDINDVVTNIAKFILYIETKAGVGMIATDITGHSIAQADNVKVSEEFIVGQGEDAITYSNRLPFEGNYDFSLSRYFDENGYDILEGLSVALTSQVDGEKNPYATKLGLSNQTLGILTYLMRRGVPVETIIKFLSQPILENYLLEQRINESQVIEVNKLGKNKKDLLAEYLLQNKIPKKNYDLALDKARAGNLVLSTETLENNLKGNTNDVEVLAVFNNLIDITRAFRYYKADLTPDTKTLKDMAAANAVQDNEDSMFSVGFIENPSSSRQGVLAPFFKARDLYKQLYNKLYMTENFRYASNLKSMIKQYANIKQTEDDKVKVGNTITNQLLAYIVQNYHPLFKERTFGQLFTGENSLPRRINSILLNNTHPLHNNYALKNMYVELKNVQDEVSKQEIDNIRIYERSLPVIALNDIYEVFHELPEDLQDDFIAMSIYQTGFNTSPYSFEAILPVERRFQVVEEALALSDNMNFDDFYNKYALNNIEDLPKTEAQAFYNKFPYYTRWSEEGTKVYILRNSKKEAPVEVVPLGNAYYKRYNTSEAVLPQAVLPVQERQVTYLPPTTTTKEKFIWNKEQQEAINKAIEFLKSGNPNEAFLIQGKAGCLGYGTKVLMYDGSYKEVQDIQQGELLMGIDSTPRTVLDLRRGVEQMYWIHQTKGMSYRVNEQHILSLQETVPAKFSRKTLANKQRITDYTQPLYDRVVKTTNISVYDYLNSNGNIKKHGKGYTSPAIEFDKKELSIDPYYLGLWLGDGSTSDIATITNTDEEVLNYLSAIGIHRQHDITYIVSTYSTLRNNFKELYGLTNASKLYQKYIPQQYLTSSINDRLQLLAGLLDSDGHYSNEGKYYEICSKHENLADQIAFLARSLGFKVNKSVKIIINDKFKKDRYIAYRLTIIVDKIIPCKISRKQNVLRTQVKHLRHTGISIEKDVVDNYYGFTLDKDHLFILEDFTVTHNTGKTTIIKEVLKEFPNANIIVGALSHKAKSVIKESMSGSNISPRFYTIAGMTGQKLNMETGEFVADPKAEKPIEFADIIVVDEASMVNEQALEMIMTLKPKKTKVIFLGDIGQLPPIRTIQNPYYKAASKKDLFGKKSPVFQTTNAAKLVTRVRQGELNPILPFADYFWNNSQAVLATKQPAPANTRNSFITNNGALLFVNKSKDIIDETVELFKQAVKDKNPNSVKFVSYKNDTRKSINSYIHQAVFGNTKTKYVNGELIIFNDTFEEIENATEAVVVNTYPTEKDSNGFKYNVLDIQVEVNDRVTEQSILVLNEEDVPKHTTHVSKLFTDAFAAKGTGAYYPMLQKAWGEKQRYANIDYGYAITSHKSQGSTYDTVIVHEQDIISVGMTSNREKSESIYTALTRSRHIAVVISSEQVKDITVPNLLDLVNKYKNKQPINAQVEEYTEFEEVDIVESSDGLKKQNLFTVTPIQDADTKAVVKASLANKYIGYAQGVANSSTALYARQIGDKYANTGSYSSGDVIFVSVQGNRGNEIIRKKNQDRTILEAIKALEAGATLLTDNKAYIDSNSYNSGEKRLYQNLEAKGYNYSEITVDGQVIGVWKNTESTPNIIDVLESKGVEVEDIDLSYMTFTNISNDDLVKLNNKLKNSKDKFNIIGEKIFSGDWLRTEIIDFELQLESFVTTKDTGELLYTEYIPVIRFTFKDKGSIYKGSYSLAGGNYTGENSLKKEYQKIVDEFYVVVKNTKNATQQKTADIRNSSTLVTSKNMEELTKVDTSVLTIQQFDELFPDQAYLSEVEKQILIKGIGAGQIEIVCKVGSL